MFIEHLIANLQNTGVFIIFLSILILVHEWGHFITAKKLGVKVEEFALGFGPTLFCKEFHGTNYMLKAFPLGGYVKMAGDERTKCKGTPDEFFSKPVGHRALIVLNGPVVNFILAYVCFVFVFVLGFPDFSTKIGEVRKDSAAVIAGLRIGDEILELNGKAVYGWNDLETQMDQVKTGDLHFKILRDGQTLEQSLTPISETHKNIFGRPQIFREAGLGPMLSTKIGSIVSGLPAAQAGLRKNDVIAEIDGKPVKAWEDVQDLIANSSGETITIKFFRQHKEMTKVMAPKIKTIKDENGQEKKIRQVGIAPARFDRAYKFSFPVAVVKGSAHFVNVISMTYKALYYMLAGSMSAKENVAGPVGIFNIVKEFSDEGFSQFLMILGIISANLAIFNLLPIIPLDGGHLFLQLIEKLKGGALPVKLEDFISRVGLSLIILLALFVFYVDFERIGLIEGIKKLLFHVKP